jgi:hypothetical protein
MPSLFERLIQDHPRAQNHFVVQVEDWNNEMIDTCSTAHAKVMGIETGEKRCSFPQVAVLVISARRDLLAWRAINGQVCENSAGGRASLDCSFVSLAIQVE